MPVRGTSATPYPILDEYGMVRGLIEGFVEPLREPLAAFTILAGSERRTGHWGLETFDWREIEDLGPTVVSMDIPEVRGDSGRIKNKRVEVPIWTKDLTMGGRKWRQYRETGLEPFEVPQLARSMARDLNNFFYFGTAEDLPGPDEGLLNHDGVDTTEGGVWGGDSGAKQMNRDLHKAISTVNARRHRGTYTLLMNGEDADVFGEFIGDTNVRIGENLPGTISRILFDEEVDSEECYIINDAPGNWEVLAPMDEAPFSFGMGNITVGTMDTLGEYNPLSLGGGTMEDIDEFLHSRIIRYMNCLTFRLIRSGDEAAVQKITFEKEEGE
jgi:hypothetical protein